MKHVRILSWWLFYPGCCLSTDIKKPWHDSKWCDALSTRADLIFESNFCWTQIVDQISIFCFLYLLIKVTSTAFRFLLVGLLGFIIIVFDPLKHHFQCQIKDVGLIFCQQQYQNAKHPMDRIQTLQISLSNIRSIQPMLQTTYRLIWNYIPKQICG